MGKRTKFQVDSKPQLRVAEATSSEGTTTKVAVPQSSELNEDSVLLEDVAFDDQKRRANVQDPRRAALTSCVALALCLDVKNTNPDDGLTNDQMRPYVAFALASPVDWLVHSAALLQRTHQEHSVYSADRAALQLEVLANQHVSRSRRRVFLIELPLLAWTPVAWELDGEVAHAMASLGAFVSDTEQFKKFTVGPGD